MSKKIMVVEDKAELCELLKYIFEKFGYSVVIAHNGSQALEKLKDKNNFPDVIIADIMMPEMDGYTFVTHLEENSSTKNIPVIMMSAKGQTKELFQYKENVYDFVEKPFQPQDLKDTIDKVMEEYGKKHAK